MSLPPIQVRCTGIMTPFDELFETDTEILVVNVLLQDLLRYLIELDN